MSSKKYLVRVYVSDKCIGNIVNMLIRLRVLRLQKSFDGINGILAIYDVICGSQAIYELIRIGASYFPLDNYSDFIITCPVCGERIDDDMIIKVYDENLLSGYNIICNREDCGAQMASVEFSPDS